jgi:hypothetical protein
MLQTGVYEHYKGRRYNVIGCARHTETDEELVVYRALYGDHGIWVRPKAMFMETVIVDGKELPRFRFLGSGEKRDKSDLQQIESNLSPFPGQERRPARASSAARPSPA